MKKVKGGTENRRALDAPKTRDQSNIPLKESKQVDFLTESPERYIQSESLLKHINCPLFVFDHRKHRIIYCNLLLAEMLEISLKDCYSMSIEGFEQMINDDDLVVLHNQIDIRLGEIYYELGGDLSKEFTYTVNFRSKKKSNSHKGISILKHCTILEWDEHSSPAVSLCTLTNISNYKRHQRIILSVSLIDKISRTQTVNLNEEFLREPYMLGPREKEIIFEMLKDKSATEIAKEKNISVYTVRSHWRNILQKTNCKTQKDLKSLAQSEGWI